MMNKNHEKFKERVTKIVRKMYIIEKKFNFEGNSQEIIKNLKTIGIEVDVNFNPR